MPLMSTTEMLTGIKNWVLGKLADVWALIPSQASSSNQLADKAFVNSSIATATATFRGTYNLVSDLSLTTSATQQQIAAAIATEMEALGITPDANDYAFVQIPTDDDTPTEIARIDRYKFDGTEWAFEYSLNNSGFTAAQWAAINSQITAAKLADINAKIDALAEGVLVSLAINPSVVYKDESQTIYLTGTMSNGTATSLRLYDGSTDLHGIVDFTTNSVRKTLSVTLTENTKTYTVRGVTQGMTLNASASVSARYPIYYGFGEAAREVAIPANRYAATTSANHTYERTLAAGSANQYFYLLVPTDITAPAVSDFTMNKAPFVVEKNPTGDTLTRYNVYRSAIQYAAGTTIKATVG